MQNIIDKENFRALLKEKGYSKCEKGCEEIVNDYLNEVLFKIVKHSQLQAEYAKHDILHKQDGEIGIELTRELSSSKK